MAKTTAKSGSATSQAIGTVKGLIGTATATDANGVVRNLQIGDKVHADDVIQTSALGTVHIEFVNASFVTVGHASSLALDETVFDANAARIAESDVERMQAQIAAGADPTEVTDAPAAGGEGEQGGHQFVVVQQNAASGSVTPGFETGTFSTQSLIQNEAAELLLLNIPPSAASDTVIANEDTVLIISPSDLLQNDKDGNGNPLSIVSVQGATNGTVALVDGNVVFTPTANYNGPASFTYTISDSNGSTSTAAVDVTVNAVNDAPNVNTDTATVAEDSTDNSINVLGNDSTGPANESGQTVTVTAASAANGTVTINPDGTLSYTPESNYFGDDIISYTVSDGVATADSTVAVTVTSVDDLPVISTGSGAVIENTQPSIGGDLSATDADNSGLAFVAATLGGDYGSLVVDAAGVWTYTLDGRADALAAGEEADELITVTLSDGSTTTVAIDITGTDDLPVLSSDDVTLSETDVPLTTSGKLEISDIDSAEIFQEQTGTTGDYGTFSIESDGKWTYTASDAYNDLNVNDSISDTFTVKAADGTETSVKVTITGTNDPEVLVIAPINSNGDNTIVGGHGADVLLGDTGGTVTTVQPGMNYNIALIVDTSGSMAFGLDGTQNVSYNQSRMKLTLDALNKLANDLAGHEGVVNVALIDFDTTATTTLTLNNLTQANVDQLIAKINALNAEGGTNYEDAFIKTANWFNAQNADPNTSGQSYENLTLFLTDGNPTFSNRNTSSTGSTTEYDDMKDAVDAFAPLSDLSTVQAVGIGNGVNTDYLKFFDNTDVTGISAVAFGSLSYSTIATFSNGGGTSGIDSAAGWSTGGGTGVINVVNKNNTSNDYLRLQELTQTQGQQTASTFTSDAITVGDNGTIRFNYRSEGRNDADSMQWKLIDASGNVVQSGTLAPSDNSFSPITSQALLNAGDYRLQFVLLDDSNKGDLGLRIDKIAVGNATNVLGAIGEPVIVLNAEDLQAALQGGSSSTDLIPVGNDTIYGGDGKDILFGDAINTDHLNWAGREDYPAGSGANALKAYLKSEVLSGEDPTDADLYDYIKVHHAEFNVQGDERGGNDVMYGDAGDDILYGQGGNDILHGGTGNDILYGGTGNDILIGGQGDDVLTGGLGSDTFKWVADDHIGTSVDVITDFSLAQGDVLDLADLLQGEHSTVDSLGGGYLNFISDGVNTTLTIDVNGPADGISGQQIVFQGIDLTAGGTMSNDLIIQSLLAGGNLKTDI